MIKILRKKVTGLSVLFVGVLLIAVLLSLFFSAKSNILGSIVKPKCPAMIPAKNTNVTPSEIPHKRNLPKISPMAEINEITTTACSAECERNSDSNIFISN